MQRPARRLRSDGHATTTVLHATVPGAEDLLIPQRKRAEAPGDLRTEANDTKHALQTAVQALQSAVEVTAPAPPCDLLLAHHACAHPVSLLPQLVCSEPENMAFQDLEPVVAELQPSSARPATPTRALPSALPELGRDAMLPMLPRSLPQASEALLLAWVAAKHHRALQLLGSEASCAPPFALPPLAPAAATTTATLAPEAQQSRQRPPGLPPLITATVQSAESAAATVRSSRGEAADTAATTPGEDVPSVAATECDGAEEDASVAERAVMEEARVLAWEFRATNWREDWQNGVLLSLLVGTLCADHNPRALGSTVASTPRVDRVASTPDLMVSAASRPAPRQCLPPSPPHRVRAVHPALLAGRRIFPATGRDGAGAAYRLPHTARPDTLLTARDGCRAAGPNATRAARAAVCRALLVCTRRRRARAGRSGRRPATRSGWLHRDALCGCARPFGGGGR